MDNFKIFSYVAKWIIHGKVRDGSNIAVDACIDFKAYVETWFNFITFSEENKCIFEYKWFQSQSFDEVAGLFIRD